MKIEDLNRELDNLKRTYAIELTGLMERAEAARAKLAGDAGPASGRVSSHDAFNLSATTQKLAELAGKIEQTENVIRWTLEAK